MTDVDIGIGKSARQGFGFDDVGIVPSRRTRDPRDISLCWEIDAYRCELPLLSAPLDAVTSPATAIEIGRLGGIGVLNLEGLWTRHDDPQPLLDELAGLPDQEAVARLRELYRAPIRPDLVGERIQEIRDAGVPAAGSLRPQKVTQLHGHVVDAGADLFVIRGTVVSAEHISSRSEPLNLKRFIGELDIPVVVGGCASFATALHLMRTGAAGLLVGIGSSATDTARRALGVSVPMATAIADAAGARMRYLDESGGRYVHVIADGGVRTGGDVAKAIACGADAVMLGAPLAAATEAPGGGAAWGTEVLYTDMPGGLELVRTGRAGALREILLGTAEAAGVATDARLNLFGGLRVSMATTGYPTLKEFQKAEVMIATGAGGRAGS